jgi:hypothetical protein
MKQAEAFLKAEEVCYISLYAVDERYAMSHQLVFQAMLVDARVRLEFAASITQQVASCDPLSPTSLLPLFRTHTTI